jgi:hypothetical protein
MAMTKPEKIMKDQDVKKGKNAACWWRKRLGTGNAQT